MKIAIAAAMIGMSFVWAAPSNADGLDPNLVSNSKVICDNLDHADDISVVHDLFRKFGRQYVADAVSGFCSSNTLKVIAGLQNFKMAEDDPGFSCVDDGNKVCGPGNTNGAPAGRYDDGGVLIQPWDDSMYGKN